MSFVGTNWHRRACADARGLLFFLGAHQPHWLADARFSDVPLFVSRRTLAKRKSLPRACGVWSLDSGGFTELQLHGRWTLSAAAYVVQVRRFRERIGGMLWAAPQDWMCEPQVLRGKVERRKGKRKPRIDISKWRVWAETANLTEALATADELGDEAVVTFYGTGLSVEEHQHRTVANFVELRTIAPDLPFIPVLQGWTLEDYLRCKRMYADAGVDLMKEPLVGVGTVCRRQGTAEASEIMKTLARGGMRLHGFGFKILGLRASAAVLASADSMAWSETAKHDAPLPGHDQPGPGRRHGHKNCANCIDYALNWRDRLLGGLAAGTAVSSIDHVRRLAQRPVQLTLGFAA